MSSPYRISLKAGKRTVSLKLYASTLQDILTFCERNFYAEIMKVEKLEFEAPETKIYPVDDPLLYKPVTYFNVKNNEGYSDVIALHFIKQGRGVDTVFNDMRTYLKLDTLHTIDAHLSITVSQR